MNHPWKKRLRLCALLLVSVALHGGLFWSASGPALASSQRPEPPGRVRVRMRVGATSPATPSPAPAQPTGTLQSVRPDKPKNTRKVGPAPAAREAAPPAVARSVAAHAPTSEPVDFTGVTLTSPSGSSSWAFVAGNGAELGGALQAAARGSHVGSGDPGEGGAGGGPGTGELRVVGLGSLSRPPRAPSLDAKLAANYPPLARAQGQSGSAVVRARVLADGRVEAAHVLTATAPEFGHACERTLSGSRWSAPLDREGRPVATDIRYTCQFDVGS